MRLPRVRYFRMRANVWREAAAWPLPGTGYQRWYLLSRRRANTLAGDGQLTREPPGAEVADSLVYGPERAVSTAGGGLIGTLEDAGVVAGPVEQSHVERQSDVLCYTTPPFDADVDIAGPLRVHLYASTSAVDTDFTAKLVHVLADSRAFNLSEGILRLSGRSFGDRPDGVVPWEINAVDITLSHTSQLVRAGERLRLYISSSNFRNSTAT